MLNPRLNHYYCRLHDQRISHQVYRMFGRVRVATLKRCNVIEHMIHTTIAILWPFGSGSKAVVSLFVVFQQRHKIKKSQTWNHDTFSAFSELEKVHNCRIKICELAVAQIRTLQTKPAVQ